MQVIENLIVLYSYLEGLPWWLSGKVSTCPCLKDPLEKEMATHSRILVWEIPRT